MYIENTRVCKTPFPASTTVEQIEDYADKVLKGSIRCILPPCAGCDLESVWFKRHEARRRTFYVAIDRIVHIAAGLLIRWKCPACGKTFTQYPDFVLPYKRYTLPTIMAFSSRYTENSTMTYRKTVRSAQLGYGDSERQLEHSTVHRWLSGLGRLTKTIAHAADMVLQLAPCSTACRDVTGLSGIGIIGRSNLLLHPERGPRIRLRSILMEGDFEPTPALRGFAPCVTCEAFCQNACPTKAFTKGKYSRSNCRKQIKHDFENKAFEGQMGQNGKRNSIVKYFCACELFCPVGA